MSRDFSADAIVGFELGLEDLVEAFGDGKDNDMVEPSFSFGSDDELDGMSLCDAIAEHLGCGHSTSVDSYNSYEIYGVVFGTDVEGLDAEGVAKAFEDAKALLPRLKKLGLCPDDETPKVHVLTQMF